MIKLRNFTIKPTKNTLLTHIPTDGLPTNFGLQDVVEPIRKLDELRKETTKSVKEFHDKVSSICQKLNGKLQQWKSISEILNTISAKSFEMIETTETMDNDNCQQILKDIDKMTNIVTDIFTNFNRLNETQQLTVLQENNDNIFITNSNIHLSTEIDLSTLSIEEGNLACASATSLKQGIMSNSVLIIGGGSDLDCLASLELYNPLYPTNNQLFEECQLRESRVNHIAAILSDTLYVVGGINRGNPLSSMELFDPIRRQWLGDGPEMKEGRTGFAGVAVQNHLMVFGGGGSGYKLLSSCESFNPVTQVWSPLPVMKNSRHGHAGVALNVGVYLIGGGANLTTPANVSIFDPNSSIWLSGPNLHRDRVHAAVAELDNMIIVTGGSGYQISKSCEMLDPRENKWMEIAPMRQGRALHALVNCNGKLFAMGGDQGEEDYCPLSTVEEYDPQAKSVEIC